MKQKHLTVFPCVLENVWSSIEIQPACPLLHKGLGHLLHLFLLSFIFSYFVYLLYRKPLKTRLISICREFLIHTTSQHLLLLVGFDTLTYRKYCDTPPILVGHHQSILYVSTSNPFLVLLPNLWFQVLLDWHKNLSHVF